MWESFIKVVEQKLYPQMDVERITLIRENLHTYRVMSETIEEQIKQIEEAIHKVHLNKLTNLDTYIKELERLAGGEEATRKLLEVKDLSVVEIQRLGKVAQTYVDQKNIIREIRYAIKLTEMEEQRLRDMKAELFARKRVG